MIESTVRISMRDENGLGCSYAFIDKGGVRITVILRDAECAIFDAAALAAEPFHYHYLLLKHYPSASSAYTDFLKLIGKMCKKREDSKYFRCRRDEDNRMVFCDSESEHMITAAERETFRVRYEVFERFITEHRKHF